MMEEPIQSTSVVSVDVKLASMQADCGSAPPFKFDDVHANNENLENISEKVLSECGDRDHNKNISDGSLNQSRNKKKNKNNFTRQQKNKKWKLNKFRRRDKEKKNKDQCKNGGKNESCFEKQNTQNIPNPNKNKHANNNPNCKHNKNQNSGRNKRLQSFSTISKFFLPEKRPRKECIIPPTKFLLGGNISDPLNLNSLQNESENAITPKSSPIPTPPHYKAKIEVIIPPNINDPLHLLDPVDSVEYELQLCSPMKRKYKARNKRKRKSKNNVSIDSVNADLPDNEVFTAEEQKNVAECGALKKENESESKEPDNNNERDKAVKNLKLDLSECGRKRRTSENAACQKNKIRRMDSMDKIVSPVIPQPGGWKRIMHWPNQGGRNRTRTQSTTSVSEEPQNKAVHEVGAPKEEVTKVEKLIAPVPLQKEKPAPADASKRTKKSETKYHYGNYDRYYDYRNLNEFIDVRLKVFLRNPHLFRDKDVLDLGCNVGLMTIAVAKLLNTKTITGIDIDKNLIAKARKNVSGYVKIPVEASATDVPKEVKAEHEKTVADRKSTKKQRHHKFTKNVKGKKGYSEFFPMSFPLSYGNLLNRENQMNITTADNTFPNNVFFKSMNYVLKDESLINLDTQQYDLIMCLSVTKWIHLNFGDSGLKMAFKRMFNHLRPGGKLILEAQNWASYKKKKKLTDIIFENYKSIEFFPNKFHDYLLSPEVGFSHSYPLGIPRHLSKGFKRPIQLYVKGDFTPSQAQWSDTYHPQTPYENTRGIYTDIVTQAQTHNCIWGSTTPYVACSSYSFRHTPSHGFPATSPYYNPKQTDSYLPSYDARNQKGSYCFASPLYSTTWSPPSDMCHRKSASNTPNSLSIRSTENDEQFAQDKHHVYPPTGVFSLEKSNAKGADNFDHENQPPVQDEVAGSSPGTSSNAPQSNTQNPQSDK